MRHYPPYLSLERALELLKPGLRVYIPGGCAEPTPLIGLLSAEPDHAAGVTFLGIWVPGANQVPYPTLHPTTRVETIFLTPDLHEAAKAGQVHFLPMGYRRAYDWLRDRARIDLAFLTVAIDGNGDYCAGLSADFTEVVARAAKVKIALINPLMPAPKLSPRLDPSLFDFAVTCPFAPIQLDGPAHDPMTDAIGRHIASLVRDRDVLQFGIGKIPGAILPLLADRRGLRIYSGMVVDGAIALMESGAIAPQSGSIFSGVALGSADLYARAGNDPAFQFSAVNETHDFRRLSAIENLVAINSALEIDLSGQVNAEAVGTQQVSGAGGIADFLRGAAAAPGGRGIIGLASTAKSGALSRIVPTLGAGVPVTVPRNDVSLVVTEHGIADLRYKTLAQRADALIAIAAPAHRPALEQARRRLS